MIPATRNACGWSRPRHVAYYRDGSSATADVLIGADGANSRVRRQLLPRAERIDTGIVAIAGKHRLDGAGVTLPHALTHDVNMVIPAGRGFLFTAVWHPDRCTVRPDADPPEGFLLDNATAYTFWAYADASSKFPLAEGLDSLSGSDLRRLVLDGTNGWAPALRDLIAGSDPDTVNAIRVCSSTPVDAWQTGPVTLLGDAIHNMTPMGGIGANTALRDADLLRRQLTAASTGQQRLLPALQEYERQMRKSASPRLSSRCATPAKPARPTGSPGAHSAQCCERSMPYRRSDVGWRPNSANEPAERNRLTRSNGRPARHES